MNALIHLSVHQRLIVVVLTLALVAFGVHKTRTLMIDAFPDVTNIQVQVATEAPGMSPEEVERFITVPIEIGLTGLPGLTEMRSINRNGLSLVTVVFQDDVETYFARQLVLERLFEVQGRMPKDATPVLGPVSTGLGEIYQYTIEHPSDGKRPLTAEELKHRRTLQDWVVRPMLRSVPGVAEINSLGGLVKQYQVLADPERLRYYDLTVGDLVRRLSENNANSSGGLMPRGESQYLIRGVGLIRSLDDIGSIVVKEVRGVPVFMRDVATVALGHEVRSGAVVKNGDTEAVGGIVMMLKDGNAKEIVGNVKARVERMNAENMLGGGLRIVPFYDRSEIVDGAIWTMVGVIVKALVLKTLVLFLLLGEIRSCLIISNTLLVAPLMTFIAMKYLGMSANLMSLTGLTIAIGLITDGAICVVENVYGRLSHHKGVPLTAAERHRIIIEASKEVAVPVAFGIAIMVLVLVPLWALEGMEGKLFKPLAITLALGLLASLILALTITPALCAYFLKGGSEEDTRLMRWVRRPYGPALDWCLAHPKTTVGATIGMLAVALALVPFLGKAFIPIMQEGAVVPALTRYSNISFDESMRIEQEAMRRIADIPGVQVAMSRFGRGDSPTDPAMPNESDPIVELLPREQWPEGWTQSTIEDEIRKCLSGLPGVSLMISQPVQQRVDELLSGVRSQIVVKIFGDDLDLLKRKAEEVAAQIRQVQGMKDLRIEMVGGQQYLEIEIDRAALARHGINVSDVNAIVETAVAGRVTTQVFEGQRRFAGVVRFPPEFRSSPEAIGGILIPAVDGATVPLRALARIGTVEGPTQISRESAQRRIFVGVNVGGRDLGGFVQEAQQRIAANVELPPGYRVVWGGQYENMQRAMGTLGTIVPFVIVAILFLLFVLYQSMRYALLIITVLPLASIGGIVGLFVADEYLSVPATIGFIALWGIAVINAVVLVEHVLHLRKSGLAGDEAIRQGCQDRLRPVLMTAALTNIGLVPMLLADGIGSEVQRPLAAVVVYGVVSATVLTMLVVPAMLKLFEGRALQSAAAPRSIAPPIPAGNDAASASRP